MQQNTKISQELLNDIKSQNNDINLNILQFINKYTKLYINTKQSQNLSKHSLNTINKVLDVFYEFLADEYANNDKLNIKDINRYFINNFLLFLTQNGLNDNSQKLYLTILKSFLYFIADYDTQYNFIKTNNTKLSITSIKIKTQSKEKPFFTKNEQQLIINLLTKLDNTRSYLAQRNSLMIKLLLFTGLRASELINIKWSDINDVNDDTHGIIYNILIMGKGRKERYIYMQYSLIAKNLDYLQDYSNNHFTSSASSSKSQAPYIFTSTHGNQCDTSMLYVVMQHILTKAGITKSGLHIFRHTFARNLVDKDINLSTISELLGHSNIGITAQFYAKSNENAKKNALFK